MNDLNVFSLWHYIIIEENFNCFVADQNLQVFGKAVEVYRKAAGHTKNGMDFFNKVGREYEYLDLKIHVYTMEYERVLLYKVDGLSFVLDTGISSSSKIDRHVVLFGRTIKRFIKAYEAYDGHIDEC